MNAAIVVDSLHSKALPDLVQAAGGPPTKSGLYNKLAALKPFVLTEPVQHLLRQFRQSLVDYLALGPFRGLSGVGRSAGRLAYNPARDLARQLYARIALTTQTALVFHDRYDGASSDTDLAGIAGRTVAVGRGSGGTHRTGRPDPRRLARRGAATAGNPRAGADVNSRAASPALTPPVRPTPSPACPAAPSDPEAGRRPAPGRWRRGWNGRSGAQVAPVARSAGPVPQQAWSFCNWNGSRNLRRNSSSIVGSSIKLQGGQVIQFHPIDQLGGGVDCSRQYACPPSRESPSPTGSSPPVWPWSVQ